MDFSVKSSKFSSLRSDCLVISVYANESLSLAAKYVDEQNQQVSHWLGLKDGKLKAGSVAWIASHDAKKIKRILLVCVGESPEKLSTQNIRDCVKAVTNAIKSKNIKSATWSVDQDIALSGKIFATLVAEGVTYGTYQYTTSKTKDLKPIMLQNVVLHSESKFPAPWKTGLAQGQSAAEGMNFAKQLGNLPANYCTPSFLADEALAMADETLEVKVLDAKQMKKLGMGAFLSVAAGSDTPPKFIIMEYTGGGEKEKPTVIVGKGITFDTGGISLKPGLGMDEMKFDMCGAASVFGVMKSLTKLKPATNVVGVVAATENMPSGRATKPGDVVTTMSGQTVEVLNTDAEGRLVLCDALTYVSRLNPKHVIDVATLTGACVIALGNFATGLFSNDQSLADSLLTAGKTAGDKAWQMPLWDEYQKSLDSNFADIANIGGREAGSVTAACFLSRFTEQYSWAHLDIAGTAWNSGALKGATGRPVGMLLQFITGLYNE